MARGLRKHQPRGRNDGCTVSADCFPVRDRPGMGGLEDVYRREIMKCIVRNYHCSHFKHLVLETYCDADNKEQCITLRTFLEYADKRRLQDPDPGIRQACNDLVNELGG